MENQFDKIAFFDLESTGVDTDKDRIVQIAVFLTDLNLNIIQQPISSLVNPQMSIPEDSTKVHGITDEMVKDAPVFESIASGVFNMMNDCHLAGFNVIFDIKMLISELRRCNLTFSVKGRKILDSYKVIVKKEPRDQVSLYKYYLGKELVDAHDAKADILATHEIMLAQVQKYGLQSIDEIDECSDSANRCDLDGKIVMKDGVPVFTFGKHFGQPISEHESFLRWMLSKDFSSDTKEWIQNYLKTIDNGK